MASNLAGFRIPFIFNPKTPEEKIEEAKRSGLIKKNGNFLDEQVMCCKRCGSTNVLVGTPYMTDKEKGCEIPYYCRACDYEGTRVGKLQGVDENGVVKIDLVPDGLVGVYGTMVNV